MTTSGERPSWTPADAAASLAAMGCSVKARALGVHDLLATLHEELGQGPWRGCQSTTWRSNPDMRNKGTGCRSDRC
jgi:hypothetical protein